MGSTGDSGGNRTGGATLERVADVLSAIRHGNPDLAVLAIHWLHLKHPLHPVQQELLTTGGSGPRARRIWQLGVTLAKVIAYACYLAGVSFVLQWQLRHALTALRAQRVAVVAKTWSFGPRPSADGADLYYGQMQRRLAERGIRVMMLCGDASRGSPLVFARGQISVTGTLRMPEMCLLPFYAPLAMAAQQVRASWRLWRFTRRARDPLARKAAALASIDCLAPQTTWNGLYFWIMRAAVQQWRPRAIVTLYEGHAWEKCAWWGVKVADQTCKTVGYQHTVLLPHAYALLRPDVDLPERSLPDVVLCLGERSCRLLNAHARHGAVLVSFGTFRRSTHRALGPADPARRTILVTPEGRREEVDLLFSFALSCAARLPHYRFIFRAHPDFPMERALTLIGGRHRPQGNVLLSEDRPLSEDFHQASVLLYRGSSTVLYAVLEGLRPVYLDTDGLRIDPLVGLSVWRESCRTPNQLEEILRAHESAPSDLLGSAWRHAFAFVDECVAPVDDDAIDRFIRAVAIDVPRVVSE